MSPRTVGPRPHVSPRPARVLPALLLGLLLALGCSARPATRGADPGPRLAPLPPGVPAARAVRVVAAAFGRPVTAVSAPVTPGRWLVLEQAGRILAVDESTPQAAPRLFADLRGRVDASSVESGLLGFAFDPGYAQNGRVYLSYTGPGLVSTLSRFLVQAGEDTLDPDSERVLLTLQQPGDVHNGGKLLFGPDGFLYHGLGDGAQGLDPGRHGQNPGTLFGSILRLDVSGDGGYRIPPDNPFTGGGGRPEVYAYGFRNPWGIAFDRGTGELWVADVGENDREEVNRVRAGGNYGWSVREGTRCVRAGECGGTDLIDPVHEYTHAEGCSITGGTVYRGRALPWLRGAYVFADWCNGTVWGLYQDPAGRFRPQIVATTGLSIAFVGEDPSGELYLLDYAGGGFYRLAP